MAPKYKLTYFNGRGLAEVTRLLFAYKGVQYEDVRLERDKWPEMKPTTPFGQLPLLEVDGHVIAQSRAIARFVAKELGLTGKNNIEAAQCDMVIDEVYDTFHVLVSYYVETDDEKKTAIHKKFVEETFPNMVKNLGKVLSANGKGFFVGDAVTWADILLAHFVSSFRDFKHGDRDSKELLEKFPDVKEHITRILELPNIKQWIEKRPVTDF